MTLLTQHVMFTKVCSSTVLQVSPDLSLLQQRIWWSSITCVVMRPWMWFVMFGQLFDLTMDLSSLCCNFSINCFSNDNVSRWSINTFNINITFILNIIIWKYIHTEKYIYCGVMCMWKQVQLFNIAVFNIVT